MAMYFLVLVVTFVAAAANQEACKRDDGECDVNLALHSDSVESAVQLLQKKATSTDEKSEDENAGVAGLHVVAEHDHACHVACVYSNNRDGHCEGDTCVCVGHDHPQRLSGHHGCQANRAHGEHSSCHTACVYSNNHNGHCEGSSCVCTGGDHPHSISGHHGCR
mmetsp:Transcript_42337/g.75982  ORF Transcript_42337/g.75982 Transcript_42337/m.75982 type:complete len:164 (-) Transcript_42337:111-602(-)